MSEEHPKYNTGIDKDDALKAFSNKKCCLHFNHSEYLHPEPEEVTELIKLAGWTITQTAKLVGVSYTVEKGSPTLRRWRANKSASHYREIPYSAWRLMLIYAGVVKPKNDVNQII